MGQPGWTPSIVPDVRSDTVFLVADCFGRTGNCVWREAEADHTDFETVVQDLLAGQYSDPNRVIAFNLREGWARDVSSDIAREIRRLCDIADTDAPEPLEEFLQRHEPADRQLMLRLA
jgi:hypothetical protein